MGIRTISIGFAVGGVFVNCKDKKKNARQLRSIQLEMSSPKEFFSPKDDFSPREESGKHFIVQKIPESVEPIENEKSLEEEQLEYQRNVFEARMDAASYNPFRRPSGNRFLQENPLGVKQVDAEFEQISRRTYRKAEGSLSQLDQVDAYVVHAYLISEVRRLRSQLDAVEKGPTGRGTKSRNKMKEIRDLKADLKIKLDDLTEVKALVGHKVPDAISYSAIVVGVLLYVQNPETLMAQGQQSFLLFASLLDVTIELIKMKNDPRKRQLIKFLRQAKTAFSNFINSNFRNWETFRDELREPSEALEQLGKFFAPSKAMMSLLPPGAIQSSCRMAAKAHNVPNGLLRLKMALDHAEEIEKVCEESAKILDDRCFY